MTKTRVKTFACFLLSLVLCGLSVYCEYTTSVIETVTAEDAHSDAYSLPYYKYWDKHIYQASVHLEPLREYFNYHCKGSSGREAAQCLSDTFAWQFRHDSASTEFLQAEYDPVDALARHSKGEPGDCVTRSGLIAAILLSVGIPARVVQFVPYDRLGHTVVSVWNGKGWTVVDPTTGLGLKTNWQRSDDVSEVALWRLNYDVTSYRAGPAPQNIPATIDYPALLSGALVYPEPWLYMRVGQKQASWPFRGAFVEVKRDGEWPLGTIQLILRNVIGALVALGIGLGWRRQ